MPLSEMGRALTLIDIRTWASAMATRGAQEFFVSAEGSKMEGEDAMVQDPVLGCEVEAKRLRPSAPDRW